MSEIQLCFCWGVNRKSCTGPWKCPCVLHINWVNNNYINVYAYVCRNHVTCVLMQRQVLGEKDWNMRKASAEAQTRCSLGSLRSDKQETQRTGRRKIVLWRGVGWNSWIEVSDFRFLKCRQKTSLFLKFSIVDIIDLRERNIDVGRQHWLFVSCTCPSGDRTCKTRYVSWLGTEPAPFFGVRDDTPNSDQGKAFLLL